MSLLLKRQPLVISPLLACRIGLNEAIVLQQICYWLEETTSGVEHDGKKWIYNTIEQWNAQFPFWSPDTVKRSLTSLKKRGLVEVKQLNKSKHDRTNYYAINWESPLLTDEGNLPSSNRAESTLSNRGKMPSSNGAKSAFLHTEITTENTSEINGAVADESAPGADGVLVGEVLPKSKQEDEKPKQETVFQEKCRAAWKGYGEAYFQRYGVAPVRNPKVNSQVKNLVTRLGAEAADVAAWFVLNVNESFVVRKVHDLGLLVANAEGYRTQWATGRAMTNTRASQIDQTAANFSAADEAKALLRAKRERERANNAE